MLKNLKVQSKILSGYTVVVLITVLVGLIAIFNIRAIENKLNYITDEIGPTIETADDLIIYLLESNKIADEMLTSENVSELLSGTIEYKQMVDNLYNSYEELEKIVKDRNLTDEMTSSKIEFEEYDKIVNEMFEEHTIVLKRNSMVNQMMQDFENVADNLDQQLEELANESEAEFKITQNMNEYETVEASLKLITIITQALETAREYLAQNSTEQLAALREEYTTILGRTDRYERALINSADTTQERREVENLVSLIEEFEGLTVDDDELFDLYEELLIAKDNSHRLEAQFDIHADMTKQYLVSLTDYADAISSDADEVAAAQVNRTFFILILIIIISALVSTIIGVLISRTIVIPMKRGVEMAELVATGDLTATIDVDQNDELGQLATSLKMMVEKISAVVSTVLVGSDQIASASEQLAIGNQDLSGRTELQASALEQTSAAIEEMNSSIRSNADNTKTADQLSRDALDKTKDGSEAVDSMISSMTEISISSNKIADIIEVINNIAFQTNLLALNASIEAARAGEQGKGFAVVAVEVRKLAKRSDKAASEIATIIKSSNQKVEEGVEIANRAGTMLTEINSAVKKVTSLVSEISATSQEQLTSADQIDRTITSLDENTQKNATLVEEAASSTEELSKQTEELRKNIRFFKTEKKSVNSPLRERNIQHYTTKVEKTAPLLEVERKERLNIQPKKKTDEAVLEAELNIDSAKETEVKTDKSKSEESIKEPEIENKTDEVKPDNETEKESEEKDDKKPRKRAEIPKEQRSEAYEIFSEMADSADFSEF